MNRISRLAHKAIFISRQRRAIPYGHNYVITDKEIRQPEKFYEERPAERKEDIETKILTGFDPSVNEQDRRILFDVTRMRTNEDKFDDETSEESESSGDGSEEED